MEIAKPQHQCVILFYLIHFPPDVLACVAVTTIIDRNSSGEDRVILALNPSRWRRPLSRDQEANASHFTVDKETKRKTEPGARYNPQKYLSNLFRLARPHLLQFPQDPPHNATSRGANM